MNEYWAAYEADMFGHVTQANAPSARIEQRHRRAWCGNGLPLSATIHPPAGERRAIRRAALATLFEVIDSG